MNIIQILSHLRPGADWIIEGTEYSGLTWLDEVQEKPTLVECEAAWPEVQAEVERLMVDRNRKQAFAERSDPLFFKFQRGEATEQEWLDSIDAVRTEFPYLD